MTAECRCTHCARISITLKPRPTRPTAQLVSRSGFALVKRSAPNLSRPRQPETRHWVSKRSRPKPGAVTPATESSRKQLLKAETGLNRQPRHLIKRTDVPNGRGRDVQKAAAGTVHRMAGAMRAVVTTEEN